jgi:C4-dicarboxylate transporter DctM subunit
MVIFGGLANVSIGKLFLAGMVPGVMMALYLMATVYIISQKRGYPKDQKGASLKELWASFKGAFLSLLMPIIVLGGILSGIFTATEAAGVAALYAMFLGFVVERKLSLRQLPDIFADVAVKTAVVMVIIAATAPLKWIVAFEQIPQAIYDALTQITSSPWVLLLILNIVFLILGAIMENTAAIILSVPILMPVITEFGIDPIHFGIVMILNLMIGLITPPVGLCLYTTCAIAGLSIEELLKEIWAFFIALLAVLFTVTYFPDLFLWLPNLLMAKFS